MSAASLFFLVACSDAVPSREEAPSTGPAPAVPAPVVAAECRLEVTQYALRVGPRPLESDDEFDEVFCSGDPSACEGKHEVTVRRAGQTMAGLFESERRTVYRSSTSSSDTVCADALEEAGANADAVRIDSLNGLPLEGRTDFLVMSKASLQQWFAQAQTFSGSSRPACRVGGSAGSVIWRYANDGTHGADHSPWSDAPEGHRAELLEGRDFAYLVHETPEPRIGHGEADTRAQACIEALNAFCDSDCVVKDLTIDGIPFSAFEPDFEAALNEGPAPGAR